MAFEFPASLVSWGELSRWHWGQPYALLLLALLPLMVFLSMRRDRVAAGTGVPSQTLLSSLPAGRWLWLRHVQLPLRCLVLGALALALARPQWPLGQAKRSSEGLDIVLAVDTSDSMRALDFSTATRELDRLSVVKEVMLEFVEKRSDDRLGLVVFGTDAFTQAPLTLDHAALAMRIDQLSIGMAGERTAIGDAIGMAIHRLKDLEAESKVIILLTDGSQTAGDIQPLSAARAAKALGIKVYTIAVGRQGRVPFRDQRGRKRMARLTVDTQTLKKVAEETGARFFEASDTKMLEQVYSTIDSLEKREVESLVRERYDEWFAWCVWLAVFGMAGDLLWSMTRFRPLWRTVRKNSTISSAAHPRTLSKEA